MIARQNRLTYRLIAAGALLLLAFLPLVLSKHRSTIHPVAGFQKMTMQRPADPGQ